MALTYAPNTDTDSVSKAQENLRNRMKDDGEDQDWKNDAVGFREEIFSLIEETSGTRGLLELEKAISGPHPETKCVLIRLHSSITLSNRGNWPHVASYRLWRWPDLPGLVKPVEMYDYQKDASNHHLNSLHQQEQSICVNPYHYWYDSGDVNGTQGVKGRLLGYKKDGRDQLWIDRSTDCLNMVLSLIEVADFHVLFNLEDVISTENPETSCILIKPNDARLNVKGEKYLPHVASYKLWRCPDLVNAAAGIQPILKYQPPSLSFHWTNEFRKSVTTCINPFHYEETPEAATVKLLKDYYVQKSQDSKENRDDFFDRIISLIDEDMIKTLGNALQIEDTNRTECVIIKPTTTAGMIYINRKPYWPHVVSCRLWRWHNLKNCTDKIQPIAEYEGSQYHHAKTKAPSSIGHPKFEICINPFHYQEKRTPPSASVGQ